MTTLEKLKSLYEMLIGEPDPDEEEEAQKELVGIFKELILTGDTSEGNITPLLEKTLEIIEGWDTLESWFKEVPDLADNMKLVLKKTGMIEEPKTEDKSIKKEDTKPDSIPESKPKIATEIKKEEISSEKTLSPELSEKLSLEIANGIAAATSALPPGMDISLIIKSVTEQITKNFMDRFSGNGDATVEEVKVEKKTTEPKLVTAPTPITESKPKKPRLRLEVPEIRIPKVTKPIKKIVPKEVKPVEMVKPEQIEVPSIQLKRSSAKKSQIVRKISAPQVNVQKVEVQKVEDTPKKSIALPTPKKISIPQPKKVELTKITDTSPNLTKAQPITLKKATAQPSAISRSLNQQNVPQKPTIQSPQRVNMQTDGARPTLVAKPKVVVKAKPISVVKPVSQNRGNSGIEIVNPVKIPTKNAQQNLFEAFQKKPKPQSGSQSSMGGVKAVSISGGNDGFSGGAQRVGGSDSYEFIPKDEQPEVMSKDKMYQELIALEGRKYAIERNRKEMRTRHEKGQIGDPEYRAAIERFKYDLEHISQKINDMRQRIQSL